MSKTGLPYLDEVLNVTSGCTKISEGCANCYADSLSKRFPSCRPDKTTYHPFNVSCPIKTHPERLEEALHWRRPRRAGVCFTSDLFHDQVPDDSIDKVFAVMALTPQHTYLLLTKRPERMRKYLAGTGIEGRISRAMDVLRIPIFEGEEWKPIPGYPDYSVSNLGRVASDQHRERRIMRPDVSKDGYLRVQLHRDGSSPRGDRLLVHRLVLQTFVGPAPQPDTQACHLDGNPSDNRISNLRWGSASDNWEDRARHGQFRAYSKLSDEQVADIRRRGATGEAAYSIAKDFPVSDTQVRNIIRGAQWVTEPAVRLPLENCWLGVSAENQRWADERIPLLLSTPAAHRWVSLEPLLEAVNLGRLIPNELRVSHPNDPFIAINCLDGYVTGPDEYPWGHHPLDLVIVGGESGPHARPCNLDWIRSIRDQCKAAGVPFYMKQDSNRYPGKQGRIPDDLWSVKELPDALQRP